MTDWIQLLTDPTVSEIEGNGPSALFYKQKGLRKQFDFDVTTEAEYIEWIRNEVAPKTRMRSTFDTARFLYESPLDFQGIAGRCHIVLPPATDYAQVTIAKRSTSLLTLESICEGGSFSPQMLEFLKEAIKCDLTLVVSGGTGAGKTTFLEACSKLIPDTVRIGVAEDTPELSLVQPNVSSLHSRPWSPGMDKNDEVTLSWIVRQFQRMRLDRLVIGETRGGEFADFLIAANSGMEGSMTTLHANNAVRCLEKMTNFAIAGSERRPIRSINREIASAVDLIVQLTITKEGKHRMKSITEVTDVVGNTEDAQITTNQLFVWDPLTDTFTQESNPTDALRNKMLDRGADIEKILTERSRPLVAPVSDRNDRPRFARPGRF